MTDRSDTLPVPAPARRGWLSLRRRSDPGNVARPRVRVIRRGWLGSLLAPVGMALGLVIVVVGLAGIATTWWLGFERHRLFSLPVKSDGSVAEIAQGARIAETVTILVRDGEGNLVRRVAEREAADRHLNEAIARLDAARDRVKASATAELDSLFALAFADRDAAVEDYADWFFEWKRPYVVMKEAVVSVVAHIAETGEYEPLATAVERDLETYFIEHYSDRVLRPDFRDPLIAAGFEEIARRAHDRWRQAVVEEDLRLQLFLERHTDDFSRAGAAGRLSAVTLDWRAQGFKAPTHLMDDATFDGMVSLGAVGVGGTLGAYALGPVMNRTLTRAFSGLGRRYAAAFGGRIAMAEAGAVAGTAVQPVSGTVVGAVAGGVLGLAVDYMVSQASEAIDRESFVEANQAAVDSTVATWKGTLRDSSHAAVDGWFDQSRAALVASR